MKHYTEKSAMNMAIKDMSDEFSHRLNTARDSENWFFSPWMLLNKQTRKLNKVLGINKLNYIK